MTQDDLNGAPPRDGWLELANGGGVLLRDPSPPNDPNNAGGTDPRVKTPTSVSTDPSADER